MKRFLSVFLIFVFSLLFLVQPAVAQSSVDFVDEPLSLGNISGPDWNATAYSTLGNVQTGDTGILSDQSLINVFGYNPSRSYSSNTPLTQILKLGDLQSTGVLQSTLGQFLGSQNPSQVSLGAFPALNGLSLSQLVQAIPGLSNMTVQSVPLVSSLLSGSTHALSTAQAASQKLSGFLSANPWAKDLPIGQLIQGDWQGAISKGVQAGLSQLIQNNPALANIPAGSIVNNLFNGNVTGLLSQGQSLAQEQIGTLIQNSPGLSNLPIGTLTNINSFSFSSIPGLTATALSAFPGIKNQLIGAILGLSDIPIGSLMAVLNSAIAHVDFLDQGATSATRPLTGGGYNFQAVPCSGQDCPNFEINNSSSLGLKVAPLNGRQWVSIKQKVKGGRGPLATWFGGKEPVHILPWGDGPNIDLAALDINDSKGTVKLGLYARICIESEFIPKTCTPYGLGPIPLMTVHENDTVIIASSGAPPISSPTLNANNGSDGVSPCGANGTSSSSQTALNGSKSSSNLKRYLDRIAAGESGGGVNLGPNKLGAYGKYQFIPSTRQGILLKYGHDGWLPAQWDQATIDLIQDVGGQQTINAISAGNFSAADVTLNGTWTSLPGGAEQSPIWSNQSNLIAYGPVSGSGGSFSGGGTLVASATPVSTGCVNPTPCLDGKVCLLHNPLPAGVFVSGYGFRPSTNSFHHGVDISDRSDSAPGSPVLAADDGIVVGIPSYVDGCRNYGYRIEINHPNRGMTTTYNHLASRNVSKGDQVKRGQQIAVEGSSSDSVVGRCSNPMITHLHFETQSGPGLRNGDFNPMKFSYDPPIR